MSTEKYIPLHILEKITNEFSAHSRIGTGGYGDVYKAVYNGREVAVKLLHVDMVLGIDDKQYINEVGNLLSVNHPNIVQLLGYSYETRSELVVHNGTRRLCQRIYRVLCFEYLQGGSLDMCLYDQSCAPNWSTRYNIIKGICEGLNFLHKCEPQIWHLDLKPANILLDSSIKPKLADFGLSRLFTQLHTHVTERIIGTWKYMPPEFRKEGNISSKNDVFSLGVVMIEIMTGRPTGYSNSLEMGDVAQLTQKVLAKWSTMIEATSKYQSEELQQVKTCMELAICCVDSERDIRPTIADILDTLNKTETHIPKEQMADVLPCPTIGPRSTKSNPVTAMITELDNITNKWEHCSYMPKDSSSCSVQQVPDRETSSDVAEELIIGRAEEKQKILSILFENIMEEMVILPIYGIGGIGKTTLAQLVFNDAQFQDYSQVWAYVSQEFDFNKIGNSIISQLTNNTSNISNKQMLHKRLKELFSGNILIVLDDLWEENLQKLAELKAMLSLGMGRKVIIVTTRDRGIARKICSPSITPYMLEILTDDMCWTIIKQKSYFEDRHDKEQLEQIGRDIATKCGGVALAAQSLGYMLNDMENYDEWESVRDSYIWNLSTSEGSSSENHEVLASLLLSYSHMPDWLKLCFSYCAVFPKGHNIVKYDLIHQWIALRFTEQSSIFDSMQLCEKYVARLLGMSFLQFSKTPSSNIGRGKDVTLFTMHDLVHDLAKEILAHQINTVGIKCRYALLTDCSKSLQSFMHFPANLMALHFRDCGKRELCGDAFSAAKFLRVLDLSECFIKTLPNCIGQLKQLRFLHAPCIQDKIIPDCITKLLELSYLNLRGSHKISALPESIGYMKGLMHIDLSGCDGISELPVSFKELRQLVHLDLSHCRISISEALGGFTKLQYLNLSVEFPWYANHIIGLPEFIGSLIKLRYLNLSGCMQVMAPSQEQIHSLLCSISTLSNLEHLDLSNNEELSSIPESIGNLRKLHTLDLSSCFHLEKLPDSMVGMVSLKVLNVGSWFRWDESMLSRLNFASLPHFVVHASNDKCGSNIVLLQPTNPDTLTIDGLENVKSAEEAQRIKLIDKQKIKSLNFYWTVAAERFVDDRELLEKLVPPSSVEIMYITGYKSLSLPGWLMDIRLYLPNIFKLDLWHFPRCKKLPPLGQLPNLQRLGLCHMGSLEEWNTIHSSGEECANELMFPKLEELTIKQCAKLRIKPCLPRARSLCIVECDNMLLSWGESSSRNSASSSSPITELTIHGSKAPLHQWKLLHHLPALRSLTIASCSDLTTSPEISQHLTSLESLSLQVGYNDHSELPTWLFELTSLQQLKICHWNLEKLDEDTRKLTRLQSLSLSECRSMTSLPWWLGELISLKKIEIEHCEGINILPDSIQQLTNLEYLEIHGCHKLVQWCKSKENKVKLAHIREVHISYPRTANAPGISETFLETLHESRVDNKGKMPMIVEETFDVPTNMDDAGHKSAAPVMDGTVIDDEVHADVLYSAVMEVPGFTEEALSFAVSHLMDNNAQASAYMAMQEEKRISWLINFLKRHH